MELAYIFISIGVFALILLLLYIARRKGKQGEKASTLGNIAMVLVILGLVFGNGSRWSGYALLGAGIIIAIIDLVLKLRS